MTSALFLDFDNIFSGLLALDRGAALSLAEHPGQLVEQLSVKEVPRGHERDLLVRRVYLNPDGTAPDPAENGGDRLKFDQFRPHFVRAGFEVIDCLALTPQHKNAADIRIVIDVLAALGSPMRYDEVIVASSDADFTPLLLKLRAEDRRTTIITANDPVPAYEAVAGHHIDGNRLLSLLRPMTNAPADIPSANVPTTCPPVGVNGAQDGAEARVHAAIARMVADAPGPVSLSATGTALHEATDGEAIRATKWFGCKNLGLFITARNPGLRVGSNLVWDPSRHAPPEL